MKKLVCFALLITLLLPRFETRAAYDQTALKNYLLQRQTSPWAIMGLSALGANDFNLNFLNNLDSNSAIAYEAPILALVAAGENPKTFAQTDYVERLKSFFDGTQLGDSQTLNDDIFGLLALTSAGENKTGSLVQSLNVFILNHQNSDGGWGFSLSADSDSNMTAAAICALIASGVNPTDTRISSASEFLKTAQAVPRPKNTSLKVDKIKALGFEPTDWKRGIKIIYEQSKGRLI